MKIDLLDKGHIELIEYLGNDVSAVEAARVSFGGEAYKEKDRNKKLLIFLMANNHHSPLEHLVFKFKVKAPIFVARQWVRHRISSINEKSGRYTDLRNPDFYYPSEIRINIKENKQTAIKTDNKQLLNWFLDSLDKIYNHSMDLYEEAIERGIAREQARILYPLSLYTEFVWTINLRSLMNFLILRDSPHAQEEIRVYAKAIKELLYDVIPDTMEIFDEWVDISKCTADDSIYEAMMSVSGYEEDII